MSDSAPDLIEPLVGFRLFNVDEDEWLGGGHGMWKPGLNIAKCVGGYERKYQMQMHRIRFASSSTESKVPPQDHAAPHEDCDCGFYAMHSIDGLRDYCGGFGGGYGGGPHIPPGAVIAAVASEGRVCLSQGGFRAEKAKVVLVAASDEKWLPRIENIARAYQAKPIALDKLEAKAAEHGAIAPASLIPETPKVDEKSEKPDTPAPGAYLHSGYAITPYTEPTKPRWIVRHGLKLAVGANLSCAAFNVVVGALH